MNRTAALSTVALAGILLGSCGAPSNNPKSYGSAAELARKAGCTDVHASGGPADHYFTGSRDIAVCRLGRTVQTFATFASNHDKTAALVALGPDDGPDISRGANLEGPNWLANLGPDVLPAVEKAVGGTVHGFAARGSGTAG